MTSPSDFLKTESLSGREWRALNEFSRSLKDFEPLAMRVGIGPIVSGKLLDKGLTEKGATPARFNRDTFPEGFRLTELGWKVLERGQKPKKAAPSAPAGRRKA